MEINNLLTKDFLDYLEKNQELKNRLINEIISLSIYFNLSKLDKEENKEEEAYRRGFQHGFGVGCWNKEEMALGKTKPSMKEVAEWRFSKEKLCAPGTFYEGRQL